MSKQFQRLQRTSNLFLAKEFWMFWFNGCKLLSSYVCCEKDIWVFIIFSFLLDCIVQLTRSLKNIYFWNVHFSLKDLGRLTLITLNHWLMTEPKPYLWTIPLTLVALFIPKNTWKLSWKVKNIHLFIINKYCTFKLTIKRHFYLFTNSSQLICNSSFIIKTYKVTCFFQWLKNTWFLSLLMKCMSTLWVLSQKYCCCCSNV